MKNRFAKTTVLILIAAFVVALMPQYPTRAATPLPEGRTYDEGHDAGYIDWSDTSLIRYVDQSHKDAVCPGGCSHNMTRITSPAYVSGSFERDVTYFEAMLIVQPGDLSYGGAKITACGAEVVNWLGGPGKQPGLVSVPLTVPPGCRDWKIEALDVGGPLVGYIVLYSVDANYAAEPDTPTHTHTYTPTATFTNTHTPTVSLTATGTFTATATRTSTGTVVPSTSTPVPVTPQVIVVTVPVIIINNTNNSENSNQPGGSGSGSSGSGGNGSFTAVTPVPWSQGQGGAVGFASGGYCSNVYVHVRVYVDYNNDGMMSPSEGVTGLQVFFLDQAYARLGSAYTVDGQTSFCLSPILYGKTLYVDIPYLQRMASQAIPEDPTMDMEIYFPGEPPTLPLYLP
jgi:hypothetical protein